MTYSQRDEESVILDYFGTSTGTYCDIGAYDGKTFSNTRALSERGWQGVCVEPSAHCFAAMASDPPPGAILVNALVGRHRGLTPFHYSKDALSTTNAKHARKWAGLAAYVPTFMVTITLGDLLEAFPGPYDLISVDTEGTTLQIVEDLIPHLDEIKTRMLVYEFDGTALSIPGFHEVHRTLENIIVERT